MAEELDDRVNGVRRRLAIGVAVFHAYAHDWLCQLRYHPRLIPGFGLSDGEGVERFWSALAALVRLNSEASKSLRLWNTHFRVDHVN